MRILRKLFVLAIAALFLAQFVGIAGGQDVNGRDAQKPRKNRLSKPTADISDITLPLFSLEIKTEKTIAKMGEKLEIEVTLTNIDSEDIFYTSPQRDFGVEVRDEMGRRIARRPAGAGFEDGSSFAASLHPGESIRRNVTLDKEFELDKVGNYFVQATRGVSETNERKSNTITITIIP
ncbi:MAG: hypothetical protein WCB05_15090 [Candidatus Sulfotelmatobacter sp.]|jgi:hypothetical protein